MDGHAFAEQLSAWVDPSAVIGAARAHAAGDPRLEQPGYVVVAKSVPAEAQAIGLDVLVGTFLRGFRLPGECVELLAARLPDIPRASWEYVMGLRFGGRVQFGSDTGDDNAILRLEDRASAARLVARPVTFLTQHAVSIAQLWMVDPRERGVFLEHSAYSDWLVFLEYTVATALGHEALARSAVLSGRALTIYGDGTLGLSFAGEPPLDDTKSAQVRQMFEVAIEGLEERWRARHADRAVATSGRASFDFATPVMPGRPPLSADDGFVAIDEADAAQPWRNIARWRNECSPYALLRSPAATAGLVIDTYYGRVFDFPLQENVGIYGITQAMPEQPGTTGRDKYLRTPYRKVPCYEAGDLGELQAALNSPVMGDGSTRLFRGQANAYTLPRSANARDVLYGDARAIEPSLLASSTRARQPLENVLPAWVQLVGTFLVELWSQQVAMFGTDARSAILNQIINEDGQRLMLGLDLHLFAISLAQHYGLPTMGLDVTADLSVALFFALHRSQRDGRNISFQRKTAGDPKSVLYVFAPDERYQMNHEAARPRTMVEGRPERQGAKFLITGWGFHRNAVARHLAMAIELDPAGDFGALPPARQLFPARGQDPFGDFLERELERGLPPELRKYVEQLYWVVDA